MDNKKTVTIDQMKNSLNSGLSVASKSAESIQEALKLFNDSMNDYISLKIEYQNILDKYLTKSSGGSNNNSYNLPGVFSSSMSSYDINAAREDNKRVTELKGLIEESERQKNYYFDALVSCFADLSNSLQKVKKYEGSINEYMTILQQKKDLM